MTSLLDVLPGVQLRGDQFPRISVAPPRVSSSGADAVALAALAGLHLDPWQQHVLDVGLSEAADGKWSAYEVCLIVARQNGKGSVLEALELAALFLLKEDLILHSAHEFKTAKDAFRRITALIRSTPQLASRVSAYPKNPSEFGVDLKSGQRLRFIARSSGSGRGYTANRVILDEAFKLDSEAMGALAPTLKAVENPQIWYASSAAWESSEQLHAVRRRALSGAAKRLAYLEWSAPEDCELGDPAAWAAANPSLGIRVSASAMAADLETMSAAKFRREDLSIPDEPAGAGVLPLHLWEATADPDGASLDLTDLRLAVDMPPERGSTSIVACGRRPDGVPQVELVDDAPGTDWVLGRLLDLKSRRKIRELVIDGAGAAASLIPALEQAGFVVVSSSARDMAAACGGLYDAVTQGSVRHVPHPALTAALVGARKRRLGDAWALDRRHAGSNISPLVGAALAHWVLTRTRPRKSDAEMLASFG